MARSSQHATMSPTRRLSGGASGPVLGRRVQVVTSAAVPVMTTSLCRKWHERLSDHSGLSTTASRPALGLPPTAPHDDDAGMTDRDNNWSSGETVKTSASVVRVVECGGTTADGATEIDPQWKIVSEHLESLHRWLESLNIGMRLTSCEQRIFKNEEMIDCVKASQDQLSKDASDRHVETLLERGDKSVLTASKGYIKSLDLASASESAQRYIDAMRHAVAFQQEMELLEAEPVPSPEHLDQEDANAHAGSLSVGRYSTVQRTVSAPTPRIAADESCSSRDKEDRFAINLSLFSLQERLDRFTASVHDRLGQVEERVQLLLKDRTVWFALLQRELLARVRELERSPRSGLNEEDLAARSPHLFCDAFEESGRSLGLQDGVRLS